MQTSSKQVKNLSNALRELWGSILIPGLHSALDETMRAWSKNTPRTTYIPRKPQSNGHLIYTLAMWMKCGGEIVPVVYDFILVLKDLGFNPRATEAAKLILQHLPERFETLTVMDSAFGYEEGFEFCERNNYLYLCALRPMLIRCGLVLVLLWPRIQVD